MLKAHTEGSVCRTFTLQVQDDTGRGVPVGFMICSSDTTEVIEHFLRVLQKGVSGRHATWSGQQACVGGGGQDRLAC